MKTRASIGLRGSNAVRQLRLHKLQKGLPFLINSKDLATNEAYLEYPNGKITLVTFTHSSRNFSMIRELSNTEAILLRKKYQFSQDL